MNKIASILLLVLIISSCGNVESSADGLEVNEKLQTEIDSLRSLLQEGNEGKQISTFLTFQNSDAEEAMNFYISLFDNSKVLEVEKYGADGPAKEGTIMFARFELNGSQYACSDSYIKHEWDFTPGVSNFVECKSNDELENLFAKLSEDGKVMMPLNNYGFSQRFGFVEDRFGVSWQLNLQ